MTIKTANLIKAAKPMGIENNLDKTKYNYMIFFRETKNELFG